jgi:hypothetical protein
MKWNREQLEADVKIARQDRDIAWNRVRQLEESNDCFMQASELANKEADKAQYALRMIQLEVDNRLKQYADAGYKADCRETINDGFIQGLLGTLCRIRDEIKVSGVRL